MSSELWRLILITGFGHNARRPLQAAVVRLAAAAAGSAAAGLYLSRLALKLNLPTDLPSPWLATLAGLVSFAVTGMLILSIVSISQKTYGLPDLTEQSSLWPLPRWSRLALRGAPYVLVWVLLMIAGSWLAVTISYQLGLSSWLGLASFFAASLAGVSLGWWRLGLISCLLAWLSPLLIGGYYLEKAITNGKMWLVGLFWLVLAGLIVLSAVSLWRIQKPRLAKGQEVFLRLPAIQWSWFSLKVWRNRRSLTSLCLAVAIASAVAATVYIRHIPVTQADSWLVLASLLSLAVACDIRGISRRFRAPEMNGLSGFKYFCRHQLAASWSSALLVGLPLLIICLVSPSVGLLSAGLAYLTLQFFAVSVGLLAGTVLVPGRGDFGGQFLAVLLASVLFFSLPKVLGLPAQTVVTQLAGWLSLALFASLVSWVIELKRRRSYGHV
ncbi:hypothetical protein HY380_01615 [Candidatus Saccharibacteria bacterium]|nr:hypothetical protein [Candidatus Saccharibacteria bacterium]